MSHTAFVEAMRRVVSGNDQHGRSVVILDGPPAGEIGAPGLGGLYEIWHEVLAQPLDPRDSTDRGERQPLLAPAPGHVKVRWFVIEPTPDNAPRELINDLARARFAEFGASEHLRDQARHPAMHQTDTLDIICLLSGDASLVLDESETRLKPGQIVVQRGVSHAWTAHDGPALFLAILIDRHVS